jgi:hypothetical protein
MYKIMFQHKSKINRPAAKKIKYFFSVNTQKIQFNFFKNFIENFNPN